MDLPNGKLKENKLQTINNINGNETRPDSNSFNNEELNINDMKESLFDENDEKIKNEEEHVIFRKKIKNHYKLKNLFKYLKFKKKYLEIIIKINLKETFEFYNERNERYETRIEKLLATHLTERKETINLNKKKKKNKIDYNLQVKIVNDY